MNTQITLQRGYSNPDVENYLFNTEIELKDFATIQGKQDGNKELEINELLFQVKVLDYVQSQIQSGIDYLRQKLIPAAKIVAVKEFEISSIKLLKKKQLEIDYNEQQLSQQNRKKKLFAPDPLKLKWRKWILFIAILVGIADGALAYKSFRGGMYSTLLSFISAIAIAGVISVSHLAYAGWIKNAPNEFKKRIRMTIILAVAFTFFAWVSDLRAQSINNIVSIATESNNVLIKTSPHISSWAICVISFVLFTAVFFLSLLFWRNKEERIKEYEYENLCKEIHRTETSIQKLNQEIEKIELNVHAEKKLARDCFDYSKKSIQRVKNIGEAAISLYKLTYARFHSNLPLFFQKKVQLVYEDSLHFFETQNEEVS